MKAFRQALAAAAPDAERRRERRWIFVPYDQLTASVGPLASSDPDEVGLVFVESSWKPAQRPYHKQKLALVLASQRAFALEQAERGFAILYLAGDARYSEQIDAVVDELGPLTMMEAAERELRNDLQPLVDAGRIVVVENATWMTHASLFEASFEGGRAWRADHFYRAARRETGLLMEEGRPEGGKWSFDAENRKAWKGDPPAPAPPTFPVDAIKAEVVELVESRFGAHPGEVDAAALPTTQEDAEGLWAWALGHCLPHFGPYEDAMSSQSAGLFHTRISMLLNNGRLLPRRVCDEVARLDAPIASREGFVRQILGWREFMRHVHRQTDGFRRLPKGHATDVLDATAPLPAAWWGEPSGLACLDHVVSDVWRTGYGHHITRLMVLSNLATLMGVDPRALSDWFWVAYVDAYDWVVEPNVLGMGTFSLGQLFMTKPYVSGAAYISRMSDYCKGCAFSPKRDCPITPMYWDFLARNEKALTGNARMAMPLRSLAKRGADQRTADREVARWARETLASGERLTPEDRP